MGVRRSDDVPSPIPFPLLGVGGGGGGRGVFQGPLIGGWGGGAVLNVACLCHLLSPMSHVELKESLCPMSLNFCTPFRTSLSHMSHVKFRKSGHVALSILGVKGHISHITYLKCEGRDQKKS